MALRPRGISRPPTTDNLALDWWLEDVRKAIEGLPFSYFSTSDGPNTSGVSAPLGTLGIELGSGGTKFWFKFEESSLTTGWQSIATS
jgi:hypothetical protein